MDLSKWFVEYIRHKDVFQKRIIGIEEKGDRIKINYKDGFQTAIIMPDLLNGMLSGVNEDEEIALVTLNREKNIDYLVKIWETVVRYKKLTVFFVNPDSGNETRWVLKPHVHNKICDGNLKSGLLSLAEQVDMLP